MNRSMPHANRIGFEGGANLIEFSYGFGPEKDSAIAIGTGHRSGDGDKNCFASGRGERVKDCGLTGLRAGIHIVKELFIAFTAFAFSLQLGDEIGGRHFECVA